MAYGSFSLLLHTAGFGASTVAPMHDPVYRRLFAFPRMVEDLLRVVGHADWIGEVDLASLEKLPAEYIGDRGQQRRGDAVWRVRFRNGWLYLLVLLEFQSTNDDRMALRNLEYTTLLYRELDRRGELGRPGRWPPVLPVVLYNGDAPWSAALEMRDLIAPVPEPLASCQPSQRSFLLDERRVVVDDLPLDNLVRAVVGFEQSGVPDDINRVTTALRHWLRDPEDTELGRAFAAWLEQIAARTDSALELEILEDGTMTLVERVAQWPEQWRREGVAEGRREGVAEGRREGVAEGRREGVAEGRREGVAEGRREGVAQERALLRRLAAVRFGEAVADEVEGQLLRTDDWDRLATVAELIVSVESGQGLIDGVAALLRQTD